MECFNRCFKGLWGGTPAEFDPITTPLIQPDPVENLPIPKQICYIPRVKDLMDRWEDQADGLQKWVPAVNNRLLAAAAAAIPAARDKSQAKDPKVPYDCVSPSVFVGTSQCLTEQKYRERFTHIITVTDTPLVNKLKLPSHIGGIQIKDTKDGEKIKWLNLPLSDKPQGGISSRDWGLVEWKKFQDYFNDFGYPFIMEALSDDNSKVLIHCDKGQNRSISFAMAYVLTRYMSEPQFDRLSVWSDKHSGWENYLDDTHGPTIRDLINPAMGNNEAFKAAYCTVLDRRRDGSEISAYRGALAQMANSLGSYEAGEDEFDFIEEDDQGSDIETDSDCQSPGGDTDGDYDDFDHAAFWTKK